MLAVYPEDGRDVATVLKHADTAMYQAKTGAAGAVAIYTPAMSSRLRDWLDLEGRLRRAVQTDLLQLQFQPKFRLPDNRIVGVEALLRWCDAEHGDISPIRFIEIAEESGLIIDMGSWVVRAACRQLRTGWIAASRFRSPSMYPARNYCTAIRHRWSRRKRPRRCSRRR